MSEGQMVLLADIILVVHFAIALFITYSLPVIWLGRWLGWRFVHNPWFRYTHLTLMGAVLFESFLGMFCPLTTWEAALRHAAGVNTAGDGQSFVAYWAGRLLFHDVDEWIFTVAYAAFFAAVVLTFFLVPVKRREKQENSS